MERLAERYELGDALGQGRSTVYRAVDTRLRRQVAIKRVELVAGHEDVEQVRTRALREAQASARLNNPAVVTVYDVVEESGAIWLVMELVDGPSLAQIVADTGPLPHRRAAQIGLGVLTALEAAHLVGVVHRDVKPANVLVTDGNKAKLTDFGVATIRDESRVTATGLIVGSPSYMAPEQATGGEITASTDLWALGALLYLAVEGVPPFQAPTALATATAVAHDDPRPVERPGPVSPIVARLLVKVPADRASAGEVRVALARIARGDRPASGGAPGTGGASPGLPAGSSPAESVTVAVPAPEVSAEAAVGDPSTAGATAGATADATATAPGAAPPDDPPAGDAAVAADPAVSAVSTAPAPDGAVPPEVVAADDTAGHGRPALVALAGLAVVVVAAVAAPALSRGGEPGDERGTATTEVPADDDGERASTPDTAGAAEATTTTTDTVGVLPDGWTPVDDPAGAYTIGLPPGWRIEPTGAANRIDLVDPATGSFLRIEWTDSPGSDAAQAWRELAPAFAAGNTGYQEIGIGPVEYRDYDAALWEFRHGSGGSLHTGNLGFVTAGRGYALMLRTPEHLWADSQTLFTQFQQAFQPT